MTSRQLYEAILIELHKENAPNILLEDFNYLANKAIYQYINKRYNIYDINQQTTDDLRVLKATALFSSDNNEVHEVDNYTGLTNALIGNDNQMATYYVDLPSDYLHMLNCICIYKVNKTYKCYNQGDTWRAAATRLTADAYSQVLDNFWMKPSYKRPYYYIHNINQYVTNPTNPVAQNQLDLKGGTDISEIDVHQYRDKNNQLVDDTDFHGNFIGVIPEGDEIPTYIQLRDSNGDPATFSNIERTGQVRYGNVSTVRCEIRYGTDRTLFELIGVYIDYIKTPQHIRLTQEELDWTEDKSQMLEFPDYVCQEIVNELVHIVMENISDQRLQTHPVVSQSIANPAQAQAQADSGSAQ